MLVPPERDAVAPPVPVGCRLPADAEGLALGVGVAFKIYYILAWRNGQTDFLQSALTRAVFYSALLTATAFGSLWFSSHPGTSSIGKLLFLSLACTLASAVLFQPALMGAPRAKKAEPAEPKEPARRRGLVFGRFTQR